MSIVPPTEGRENGPTPHFADEQVTAKYGLTEVDRADLHTRLVSWFGDDRQAFLVSHLAPVVDRIKADGYVAGKASGVTGRELRWQAVARRVLGDERYESALSGDSISPETFADALDWPTNALEMTRKADQAERRAEDAEAEVERLRDVLAEVRRVFDLQCPPMPAEKYVDRGAWMAHSWWNTVLGGILNREGVGTGAGEGATGQDTGTAWVTRSTDCPEAPAQAHLLACNCVPGICAEADECCESHECLGDCDHEWLDRPESDTRECLICGTEVAG